MGYYFASLSNGNHGAFSVSPKFISHQREYELMTMADISFSSTAKEYEAPRGSLQLDGNRLEQLGRARVDAPEESGELGEKTVV